MQNIEVIELSDKLNQTSFSDIRNGRFQYAVSKNRDILNREAKVIRKSLEESKPEEFVKLQDEIRPEVIKAIEEENRKLAEKNKAQKNHLPFLSEQQMVNIEDEIINKWEKAEQYKKLFDEVNHLQKEIKEQESDIKLYLISTELTDELPLNDVQMSAIFPFVSEDLKGRKGG